LSKTVMPSKIVFFWLQHFVDRIWNTLLFKDYKALFIKWSQHSVLYQITDPTL
jgi:hypothetical protein